MACSRTLVVALALFALPIGAQAPAPQTLAQQSDGTTPLHLAVRADDLASVQRLLRSGANPKAANRYGVTPLSLAALNGNASMIEALLKAGADPKAVLPGGQTILM